MLLEMGQSHLFEHWAEPGVDDDQKKGFFEQVWVLHCQIIFSFRNSFWILHLLLIMSSNFLSGITGFHFGNCYYSWFTMSDWRFYQSSEVASSSPLFFLK